MSRSRTLLEFVKLRRFLRGSQNFIMLRYLMELAYQHKLLIILISEWSFGMLVINILIVEIE